MSPTTRRTLLKYATLGAGSLGGCLSASPAPGPDDGSSHPDESSSPKSSEHAAYRYAKQGRWRMDGRDAGRTGFAPRSRAPRSNIGTAWVHRPEDDPHSATAPVVGSDHVFIGYSEPTETNGVYDARVSGFDAKTGEQQLDVQIGTGRVAGLALVHETLIAVTWGDGSTESQVIAVSTTDGTIQWEMSTLDVTGPPALTSDTLYLATRDGDNTLYAYALDGTERWQSPIDGECYNTPCVDADSVYVGLADGRIAALASATGRERWTERVVSGDSCCPDIQGTPTVAGDRLFVPGIDEQIAAVKTADGSVAWTTRVVDKDYGNAIPSPALTSETVYVNTNHGGLVALGTSDGTIRWRSQQMGYFQPPAVDGETVVFPRHGSVVAYDTGGEELWTFDMHVPDAGMAAYIMRAELALAHDRLYISLHDGRVYAVGTRE